MNTTAEAAYITIGLFLAVVGMAGSAVATAMITDPHFSTRRRLLGVVLLALCYPTIVLGFGLILETEFIAAWMRTPTWTLMP